MENAARIERIYALLSRIRYPDEPHGLSGTYIEFRVAYALDGAMSTTRITVVVSGGQPGTPPKEILQFWTENVTDPVRATELHLMELGEKMITIDIEGVIES